MLNNDYFKKLRGFFFLFKNEINKSVSFLCPSKNVEVEGKETLIMIMLYENRMREDYGRGEFLTKGLIWLSESD
jgi:hypothetical protein